MNLLEDLKQLKVNISKKKNKFNNFEEKISIKNLSFKYEDNENYVIKNLSLNITKGQIFGIKGKTGSGKTTLINLLCGLLSPSEGEIYYDNTSYKEIDIRSLQKIGYVPQDIYLMDDTIKENLSFGEKISDEKNSTD